MISEPSSKTYQWLFKYKLYHLPFWALYHFLWWSLYSGDPMGVANDIFFSLLSIKFLFYVFFQAVGVYFNLYFLIPRYLEKGEYLPYLGLFLLTILVTAWCIVPGYHISAHLAGQSVEALFKMDSGDSLSLFKYSTLGSTVASMTLAMSIKLTKNWIKAKQHQQALEKEKLETELKFLRSQFNPHFLFNTINSIFVLIHKNPDMASESLAKFSNLLRYQLYECNEQHIPLSHELAYLNNFVQLE
ncbi:MAG: histidine kinase, partial [Bacteroidota bacterium]